MRFYIRVNGRLSSITMPDLLAGYLIAKLGSESEEYLHAKLKGGREAVSKGRKIAQAWVNDLANRQAVPAKDVSQWVQAQALHYVVDPAIVSNLNAELKRTAERSAERSAEIKEWLAERRRNRDELRSSGS